MAEYEQKEGQGVIFKNKDKKSDKHPDYRGTALVHGKNVNIALWVKKSKNGISYFSASIADFQPNSGGGGRQQPAPEQQSDGLPF